MAMTISESYETQPEYYGPYGMLGYKDMEARGDSTDDVYVAPASYALMGGFYGIFAYVFSYEQDWNIWGGGGNDHLTAGDEDDSVFGESGHDTLIGLQGDDTLGGGSGNDQLEGGDGMDILSGGDNDDRLYGGADNDELYGGDGNDHLDGQGGADQMDGGTGHDTYIVDHTGDKVGEAAGAGDDTVIQKLQTYQLQANTENLVVAYGGNATGRGNELANMITGGSGSDQLEGLGGNDTLNGGSGGKDTLIGGAGDDTYEITEAQDVVIELAGEGTDKIDSHLPSTTLPAQVENLQLWFSGAANGSGNASNNVITGNLHANTLHGLDGHDVIDGFFGDDVIHGGNGNDALEGNVGADWLFGDAGNDSMGGSFGNDFLYGGDGNDVIRGGDHNDQVIGQAGNDALYGDAGNDVVVGGTGADQLWGGSGSDVIRFLSMDDCRVNLRDSVRDFQKGLDKIDLSGIDADVGMAGNQAFTFGGYGQPFFTLPGDLWITEANGRTTVWMDNGDGTSGAAIDLIGVGLGLTAADFGL